MSIDRECYMYGADVRQGLKEAWYQQGYDPFNLYNKRDVLMSAANAAVNPPMIERPFTLASNKHGWEVIGKFAEQYTVLALAGTATTVENRLAHPFKMKRVQSFNKPGTGREYISLFYSDGTPVNGAGIRLVDKLPPAPPKPVVNHRHTVRVRHGMLNFGSSIPTKMIVKAFQDFKALTPDLQKGEEVEVMFRTLRPVPEELIKKRTMILDKFAPATHQLSEVSRMVSQFMWVDGGSDEIRVSIEGRSLPRK